MSGLGGALLSLFALLAGVSWVVAARRSRTFRRRDAIAFAAWGLLSSIGELARFLDGGLGNNPWAAVATVALWCAAGCGIGGIAGALRIITIAGGVGAALAEAALVGASMLSVVWVLVGAPERMDVTPLLTLALIAVGSSALALTLRIPAASPASVLDERFRRGLMVGTGAILLLIATDVMSLMTMLDSSVPAAAQALTGVVGYLGGAAIPWVGSSRRVAAVGPSRAVRVLPYALVGTAVAAQCIGAFRGSSGAISLILVAFVVFSLVAVQGFALRENGGLLRDLESSRARMVALVENAGDVILGLDLAGLVDACSSASERLLRRSPEALYGEDIAELAIPEDREHVRAAVRAVVTGRYTTARAELRLAAPAAGTAELRLRGVPGGAVANLSDVTDAVQLRERLERLARYDEMTGLANRSHLLQVVDGWLHAGLAVTVLYADLDGFKAVNDRFGHLQGDRVLIEAAHRIQSAAAAIGVAAVVARMGGDEFVVALQTADGVTSGSAAKRLPAAIRPGFRVGDRTVRLGLSIGVAATDDELPANLDPRDGGDLLHRADVAMFAAKESGRSRVMRWDPAMEERALRRVDIAIGLRRALDSGRLALAYQPIVRLSDGIVVAAEALIRVHGGDDAPGALSGLADLVSPAELVEVAEDTGAIAEMGRWVLTEATQRSRIWRSQGLDLRVAVNMSVRQLASDGFVDSVRAALDAARLPADRLLVEITEGQLLSEREPGWQAVEELRDLGVILVIDDFGAGYSSLSYLRRMPVRAVKIDRTLLEGVGTDPRATTLVRAVIGAARALGLLVIAEGLESMAMVRLLRDLGAYAGQGYALSPALTPEALLSVIAAQPLDLGAGAPPARRSGRRAAPVPGSGAASGGAGAATARRADPVDEWVTSISHDETRAERD